MPTPSEGIGLNKKEIKGQEKGSVREGLDVRDGSNLSDMEVYENGRVRCIKMYSDSKENYEKRERGGTCLILELMHRLSFLPNDSHGKVYSYVRPN